MKTSLKQFMGMEVRNLYVWYKDLNIYVRKGQVRVDRQICTAITIANITNVRRHENITRKENHSRTGLFSEFEQYTRALAREYNYDGVFVENVLNEFLPTSLIRYGYKQINFYEGASPSFFIWANEKNE